jgi:hypothetical protein
VHLKSQSYRSERSTDRKAPASAPSQGLRERQGGHESCRLFGKRHTLVRQEVDGSRRRQQRSLRRDGFARRSIGRRGIDIPIAGATAQATDGTIALESGVPKDVEHAGRRENLTVLDAVGTKGVDDGKHVSRHGVANDPRRCIGHGLGKESGGAQRDLVREDAAPRYAGHWREPQSARQIARVLCELAPRRSSELFVEFVD